MFALLLLLVRRHGMTLEEGRQQCFFMDSRVRHIRPQPQLAYARPHAGGKQGRTQHVCEGEAQAALWGVPEQHDTHSSAPC